MGSVETLDAPSSAEADLLATSAAGPTAVRGGALRLGSYLIGALASTGAVALLVRHLGVVETGRYTAAMSLAAVVTGLTDLGLTTIGIRELAVLYGERRAALARNLLGLRLALTAFGVALVTAFAFAVYGRLLGLGVLIAGVGVLFQNTQTTLAVPLMAALRLGWVSALELARQVSAAVLIVALVLLGAPLLAFLAVVALAAWVVLPATVALVRGEIPLRPSFDVGQWRALVGPVFTYSAAAVTATLYLRVAIVLVSLIAGAHQVGYFSLSYRVSEALLFLPALLLAAAFPILARAALDDLERFRYALCRVFEASLIVGVWLSLSLAVGAHLVIAIFGGASFRPAVPVLAVQGIAVGAVFVSSVWSYGLLSLHLHRTILIFNLSLLALAAGAVAVATSLDGALGAAIATASVELVAAVAGAFVLTHRRPHLRVELRLLPRVAVAGIVGLSPMLLTAAPVLLQTLLASLLYALVLLVLRAVPAELSDVLLARLRGPRATER